MIRVPFFSFSSHAAVPDRESIAIQGVMASKPEEAPGDRLDAKLSSLEGRLVSHAEELKAQVSERVMRIHSRIERALRPFQPESERQKAERGVDNIVEFDRVAEGNGGNIDALLHARNAREAMLELNDTLRVTREHLEALSSSIERMKRSAARG